jgi:hypothetical protein
MLELYFTFSRVDAVVMLAQCIRCAKKKNPLEIPAEAGQPVCAQCAVTLRKQKVRWQKYRVKKAEEARNGKKPRVWIECDGVKISHCSSCKCDLPHDQFDDEWVKTCNTCLQNAAEDRARAKQGNAEVVKSDALAAASEPATAAAAPTAVASSHAASSPPKLIQKNCCPGAGASQHGCTDCLIVFNVRGLECGTCMQVQKIPVSGGQAHDISARV